MQVLTWRNPIFIMISLDRLANYQLGELEIMHSRKRVVHVAGAGYTREVCVFHTYV